MTEFHMSFLPETWEKDTCCDLLNLSMGSSSFWDFYSASLELDSVLANTTSHLPEDKFCHHLESCMTPELANECEEDAIMSIKDQLKWVYAVKKVNETMCHKDEKHRKIAEDIPKKSSRYNLNANSYSSAHNTSSSNGATKQQNQNQNTKQPSMGLPLLLENSGCLKCRKLFTDHISCNCKDGAPNAATYKTLTATDVDNAKKRTHSLKNAKPVTSVTELDSGDDEPQIHPVAAIMGTTSFPSSGPVPNKMCILENNSFNSDESMSTHTSSFSSLPPLAIGCKSGFSDLDLIYSPLHHPLHFSCPT
jgi:hypothetical protein